MAIRQAASTTLSAFSNSFFHACFHPPQIKIKKKWPCRPKTPPLCRQLSDRPIRCITYTKYTGKKNTFHNRQKVLL